MACENLVRMADTRTRQPLLTSRFQDAIATASDIHATQLRKGNQHHHLAHLMSVAALVLEHDGSEDAAIASHMHDAVEDSDDGADTQARIRSRFGDRVASTAGRRPHGIAFHEARLASAVAS